MMLVFLVDQLQQIGCKLFQMALKRSERLTYLWQDMRSYLGIFHIQNWEAFLNALAFGPPIQFLDTS